MVIEPSQEAEVVGLTALVFVAGDEARLNRFLHLTGLEPQQLRSAASDVSTLSAVLDHLMGDQPLLMAFAAESGMEPETVVQAHRTLGGNQDFGDFS